MAEKFALFKEKMRPVAGYIRNHADEFIFVNFNTCLVGMALRANGVMGCRDDSSQVYTEFANLTGESKRLADRLAFYGYWPEPFSNRLGKAMSGEAEAEVAADFADWLSKGKGDRWLAELVESFS